MSIDDFVTTFDSDRSTSESALQRALISDEIESFSLWRWIEMNLEDLTKDYEFDLIHWAGCPEGAEAPMLIKLENLVCLDVGVVCHDKDDIYRVYCDIGIVGIFECTVGCNKVNNIVHPNQTLRAYEDDKEYWSKVNMRSVATFILRLDFNVSTSRVESAYILPLEHWKRYKDTMQSIDDEVEELELDDALL